MKSIELSGNTEHPTKDVLKLVLERSGVNGMTVGDMQKRGRILNKLETANGVLELEDAEYATVKEVYAEHRFPVYHKDLLAISDAINKA